MPKAQSKHSLSPSRLKSRGELAASLQALLANDHVDLEILRPGAPWPSATEIARLLPDSKGNQDLAAAMLCSPEEPTIIDPALSTGPFPTNIDLEPDWLSNLMAYQGGEVPKAAEVSLSCSAPEDIGTSTGTGNTDSLPHFSPSSISQWDALLDSVCSPIAGCGASAESRPGPDQGSGAALTGHGQLQHQSQGGESVNSSASENTLPRKRQRPHYAIEKRYRAGLQERFEALRDCVASLKQTQHEQRLAGNNEDATEGDDGLSNNDTNKAGRMNKAEVLLQATVYIQQLQEENEVAIEHIKLLIGQFRIMKRAMRQALGQI
ncbi:hypothetical protein FNYG_11151 [Fusarium nygamai]|uniref:BHLH domain-containing protein n=1 Tax=Gibberella nygamai TaxID=42673 RepID=A0A2K0VZS4_GIBNY|nr:hypothetical protein FNYG_11151 [Fusarium nygamai]